MAVGTGYPALGATQRGVWRLVAPTRVELTDDGVRVVGQVPAGYLYVDGIVGDRRGRLRLRTGAVALTGGAAVRNVPPPEITNVSWGRLAGAARRTPASRKPAASGPSARLRVTNCPGSTSGRPVRSGVGLRVLGSLWLPLLAGHLPLPVPVPLRTGAPGTGYPWVWSIVPWLRGRIAARARIADHAAAAAALGAFVAGMVPLARLLREGGS